MILASPERIASYTERGWWGRQTLDQVFRAAAAAHPDREAVVDPPNREALDGGTTRRLSWGALAAEVSRMAAVLDAAGLRRDQVMLVQLVNSVEQYVVYLAAMRLGVIVSPVPVQYREHELHHILTLTRAVAVVTSARLLRHDAAAMWLELARAHGGLAVLGLGSGWPAGAVSLDEAMAAQAAPGIVDQVPGLSANDIATLCWTSGTEAAPKGVPRSHNEWLVIAPSIIEAAELRPGTRLLNPFPMINMAGISTCVAAWMRLGGTVVQHHPFDLPLFLQQLRDEAIDYTVAPPAILNMMLRDERMLQGIDLKRLSRIGSGSAPLSDWMVRGFAERGVQIVNYFGSNEGISLAGSPVDIPDPALRAAYFSRRHSRISTAGKVRLRLVDLEDGREITEPGHPGEIRISGPTVFAGYFGQPEITARSFDEEGCYRTGDLFEIAGDQGQYFRFVGRCKDIVVRGGMKISAEEIEALLFAHPKVADVAVVAVPDEALGEKACACVVARPGTAPTLAELAAYLRDDCRLAIYKVPEHLMMLPALPRNPVGKVLKRELRNQAAASVEPRA